MPSSRTAVFSLVLANLVPLAGVLFFGWNLFTTLALYWLENGVIGFYNLFKIGVVQHHRQKATHGREAAEWSYLPLFLLHYGMFWLGHGLFLTLLFAPEGLSSWRTLPVSPETGRTLAIALASLLTSHGTSFWRNFLGRREYAGTTAVEQMLRPYGRVVALHFSIIAGAFLVSSFGSPVSALVCLVVFKTLVDLGAHVHAHVS